MSEPAQSPAVECRYTPPVSGDLSDRRQYTLAYFWFTGYFSLYAAYFYMVGQQTIDKEALSSLKETLNYLTPLTGVVIGYFYTASISGRRKDEALANVAVSSPK